MVVLTISAHSNHDFAQFEELAPEIVLALNASKALTSSKALERLMHIVLSVGNYLNGSTPKGAAHGFMLKSLGKLADLTSIGTVYRLCPYLLLLGLLTAFLPRRPGAPSIKSV